ncbi:MAG: Maf family protein, partial [Gammaproteobacteria bacterium]
MASEITSDNRPGIHLASASPRRRELLTQIGVPFQRVIVDVDETPAPGESPDRYVSRLAIQKARAGWQALGPAASGPILGADTAVVVD